jgi:hypothetical protein
MLRKILAALLAALLMTVPVLANETVDLDALAEDYLPASAAVNESLPAPRRHPHRNRHGRVLFEKKSGPRNRRPPPSPRVPVWLIWFGGPGKRANYPTNSRELLAPASSMEPPDLVRAVRRQRTVDELLPAVGHCQRQRASWRWPS